MLSPSPRGRRKKTRKRQEKDKKMKTIIDLTAGFSGLCSPALSFTDHPARAQRRPGTSRAERPGVARPCRGMSDLAGILLAQSKIAG
jgi:hypothetical protein